MDILAKQFINWQAALDEFQKNIEKDLNEIRQQKEEVQQLKAEIIDKLDNSRYLRDDGCIGDRRRGRWQKTRTHPGTTSRGQGALCAKEIISQTSAVSWRWD